MQRKTIKITTEAHAELLKLKRAGENFSDVILRHFPRHAENVVASSQKISKEDAIDTAWLKKARRKPMRYRPLANYLADKKR